MAELFQGAIPEAEEADVDERVRQYIRKLFSFCPSMDFSRRCDPCKLLTPWEELRREIPERMREQLKRIRREFP